MNTYIKINTQYAIKKKGANVGRWVKNTDCCNNIYYIYLALFTCKTHITYVRANISF